MLSNPHWDRGTVPGLIHWLEQKPRNATYNFSNAHACLMCEYMGNYDIGSWPEAMADIYRGTDIQRIARGHGPSSNLQTYGEALERAYRAIAA